MERTLCAADDTIMVLSSRIDECIAVISTATDDLFGYTNDEFLPDVYKQDIKRLCDLYYAALFLLDGAAEKFGEWEKAEKPAKKEN